jgi:hypothetical protein
MVWVETPIERFFRWCKSLSAGESAVICHRYLSGIMSRIHSALSYGASFLLLFTAVFFSVRYLWSVYQSTKSVYVNETIFLTRGDTTQNFYTAYIPRREAEGMLVLNQGRLTGEGFRLACEEGLIVVSATPAEVTLHSPRHQLTESFRRIIANATKRYNIDSDKVIIGFISSSKFTQMQFMKAAPQSGDPLLSTMYKEIVPIPRFKGGYHGIEDERGLIAWSISTLKSE